MVFGIGALFGGSNGAISGLSRTPYDLHMTEDIDKISFAYDMIMSRAMSPFAKLLWPSFLFEFARINERFSADIYELWLSNLHVVYICHNEVNVRQNNLRLRPIPGKITYVSCTLRTCTVASCL